MTTRRTLFDFLDDDEPDSTPVEHADSRSFGEDGSGKTVKKTVRKTVKRTSKKAKPILSAASLPLSPLPESTDSAEKKNSLETASSSGMSSRMASSGSAFTVSELTLQVKGLMESSFQDVRVVGQISNLSQPRSGHVYLTLKDDGAQLPAVVWKSTASKLRFKLQDGMEIVCRGRLDVYPPQGKYQLIVNELEPKGIGTLELAFRQLHEKLFRAGLFDPGRKKPLPKIVRRIALITSPSGAAIRDFLQVLRRRTRRIDILIVPVRVQGEGAAEEIAQAVETVNRFYRTEKTDELRNRPTDDSADDSIDCIVVTRGGGSAEDLWAFNEEPLVRAVAGSRIPVVSGVGHEIDVSLCDLAADVRALTPSEAAERIAPEDAEWFRNLLQLQRQIEDSLEKRLKSCRERLRFFDHHPILVKPERIVEDRQTTVDLCEERLDNALDRRLQAASQRLGQSAASLDALSPLAVLGRGYSLTETPNGRRLRSVHEVGPGETLRTRLVDGTIEALVQSIVQDIQPNTEQGS